MSFIQALSNLRNRVPFSQGLFLLGLILVLAIFDFVSIFLFKQVNNPIRIVFFVMIFLRVSTMSGEFFLPAAAAIIFPNMIFLGILCYVKSYWNAFLFEVVSQAILLLIIFYWNTNILGGNLIPIGRYKKLEDEFSQFQKNAFQLLLQFSLLSTLRDQKKVLDQVVDILQSSFKVQAAVLYWANYTTNELRPVRTIGFKPDSLPGLAIKVSSEFWPRPDFDPGKGLASLLGGKKNFQTIKQIIPATTVDSIFAIPLAVEGRIVGLLNIVKQPSANLFMPYQSLLMTLGSLLSSALQNSQIQEALLAELDQAKHLSKAFQKRQEEIRSTFSRYVSPEVVAEMEKYPTQVVVGGQKREITVMFTDLRGFTSLTTVLPLEPLVQLLNDWFEIASQIILNNFGTIDKYQGDGIMVLFGAPIKKNDDALRAVFTAFKLHERFSAFREDRKEVLGGHKIGLGISLCTGEVIVGNFGSSTRMEYTAIGDTVNFAARLEKVSKDGEITVNEETVKQLQDRFTYEVENHEIKGKGKQTVYKLKEILKGASK